MRVSRLFVGALVAVPLVVTGPSATAAPDPVVAGVAASLGIGERAAEVRLAQQEAAHRVADGLPEAVTSKLAGQWFDSKTGQLVVAVTDRATADAASAAGARPTIVSRSRAELERLQNQVARLAAEEVPGLVAYGIDAVNNRVRVRVTPDRSAATQQFVSKAKALGVAVEQVASKPELHSGGRLQPGSAWWPTDNPTRPEGKCSVGFGVKDAQGGKHFLTAGHCTNEADEPAWGNEDDTNRIGTANVGGTSRVYGIDGDYGLVAVTEPNWLLLTIVRGSRAVTVKGSTEALVGEVACQSGAGEYEGAPIYNCNTVRAVDQTYDFGLGDVGGLTVADGCAHHGDSGGPWVKGEKGVGLHVGGWEIGECGPGVDGTIFNPLSETLAKWNLTLMTEAG